jgi:hypothetical protein
MIHSDREVSARLIDIRNDVIDVAKRKRFALRNQRHNKRHRETRYAVMGMFDALNPFTEAYKENTFFTLVDAKVGNEIETEFGAGTPVLLKIREDEGDKWYSLFGEALVNQVGRMEPGELRGGVEVAVVRLPNKAGNQSYKVLATREQVESGEFPEAG